MGGGQRVGEVGRQGRDREPRALGGVGDEAALATRVRQRDHACCRGVVDPAPNASRCSSQSGTSSTVIAPCAAHSAASACAEPTTAPECASAARDGGLRAPAREHDHGLAGARGQRERLGERRGAPDRLERQADRRRLVVRRERREPVGGIAADLVAARDDGAQAEARAGMQQCLAERARVHDAGTRRPVAGSACGTLPIQAEAPPGTATPMQLGPTSGTFERAHSTDELGARDGALARRPRDRGRVRQAAGFPLDRLMCRCDDRAGADRERADVRGEREVVETRHDLRMRRRPAGVMHRDGHRRKAQVRPEVEPCAAIGRTHHGRRLRVERDPEIAPGAIAHAARARRRRSSSSSAVRGARRPGSRR